jgi:hypothetical protein
MQQQFGIHLVQDKPDGIIHELHGRCCPCLQVKKAIEKGQIDNAKIYAQVGRAL